MDAHVEIAASAQGTTHPAYNANEFGGRFGFWREESQHLLQPAARHAEIMDDFRHIADECFGIQRRESFQAFAKRKSDEELISIGTGQPVAVPA